MKTILFAMTLLISTQTFAAKCIVSGLVKEGMSCSRITTRFSVDDVEACEAFAKSTEGNRFFNIMEDSDILISSRYTFKDRPNRIKVKKTFMYGDEEVCL